MQIDQWTKFIESIAGDTDAKAIFSSGDVSRIRALAQSKGYSFTEQDIEDARIKAGELRESELEGVSGGAHIMMF